MAPDVPLPQESVITRWETWTDGGIYYCNHFEELKYVGDLMKTGDARAIEAALEHLRFEVFTAVTMKNGVFWDVTPCGSCKN
jgi:hypothetical protein